MASCASSWQRGHETSGKRSCIHAYRTCVLKGSSVQQAPHEVDDQRCEQPDGGRDHHNEEACNKQDQEPTYPHGNADSPKHWRSALPGRGPRAESLSVAAVDSQGLGGSDAHLGTTVAVCSALT